MLCLGFPPETAESASALLCADLVTWSRAAHLPPALHLACSEGGSISFIEDGSVAFEFPLREVLTDAPEPVQGLSTVLYSFFEALEDFVSMATHQPWPGPSGMDLSISQLGDRLIVEPSGADSDARGLTYSLEVRSH